MSFCKFLGKCGSCKFELDYDEQIRFKFRQIKNKFCDIYVGEFEIFKTKPVNFRSRAEFKIYHQNGDINYAMNGVYDKFLLIDKCMIVDEKILNLMPNLLDKIAKFDLKERLFGVEFITSKDEIMAILLFHRNIYDIEDRLLLLHLELGINLIARSRGKKLVFGSEDLNERLFIDNKEFKYIFSDGAFIQPNRQINEKMINWVLNHISSRKDLLELYCGHGNFTIPLSFKFNNVLATEISKKSIQNALKNCDLNSVNNIKFIRISSEDLIQALNGSREFFRLRDVDLNSYEISHILVDPPRAGCDESVLKFIKDYPNIIYISCNPNTLKRDLSVLCKTHRILNFAIFDQFAHTNHIECGVILSKI